MNLDEMTAKELEQVIDDLGRQKETIRLEQDRLKVVLNEKLKDEALDAKLTRFKPHELEKLAQRVTAKSVEMTLKTQGVEGK